MTMAQRVEHHPLEAAFAALLANSLDGAGKALRILVNAASKIERAQFLNARPDERTTERTDYANGFKVISEKAAPINGRMLAITRR